MEYEVNEDLLLGVANEVGHSPGFLLSEIERDIPQNISMGWQDGIPNYIAENWHHLSKDARLVAICVASNSI